MATVVNNPPASDNSGGPLTMFIVLIIVVVIGYFGVVYILPTIRQMSGGTQIAVPDEIDVNINQETSEPGTEGE